MEETVTSRLRAKGDVIRRERLALVLRQDELAEKASLGLSTLRTAERSERVAASTIRKLAEALDVAPRAISTIVDE